MASPEQHYLDDDHTDKDEPNLNVKTERLLQQAEREIVHKTEALRKSYDQLAEYEQRVENEQQKAQQLEAEKSNIRLQLEKEQERSKGGELAYEEAEKKITELEKILVKQRERAQDAMKELKARIENEEDKSARLQTFVRDVVTQVNSYKNQMMQDNKDRARFEQTILEITGIHKERSKKILEDMQKMKAMLPSSQGTLTSKGQKLLFPELGVNGRGPGSSANVSTGGSGLRTGRLMTGSEGTKELAVNGISKGIQVNDKPAPPNLGLLEMLKTSSPYIDPASSLQSPSDDSVAGYSDTWSHPSTMSPHPGQFRATLDKELDLESMATSRTSSRNASVSDQTYRAPGSSGELEGPEEPPSTDNESDILTVHSCDDEPTPWRVYSPPMRPNPNARKRMRYSSPDYLPVQPDAARSSDSDSDSSFLIDEEDLEEERPATPPKKAKITKPKSILRKSRRIPRRFPSREEQEFRLRKQKAEKEWTEAHKDLPPLSPSISPESPEATSTTTQTQVQQGLNDRWIMHKHLEDLPFKSADIQTQTEWPEESSPRAARRVVFTHAGRVHSVRPHTPIRRVSGIRRGSSQPEDQDKPERPTTLMPGRWPLDDTSEEDAGSVANPMAHVFGSIDDVLSSIDEFVQWVKRLIDERPNEMVWGILFMGSLLWVVVSQRSHRLWLDANEVPLDILSKVRNSRMSEISWSESFDFGVMRLFHHDRTVLG
ncbi:hypothetical protein N7528_004174 [Penicillium herquei]|nr:hypothetical protein N7528_004174 [Penicillium herquei]